MDVSLLLVESRSSKQTATACSTMKAEFTALDKAAKEAEGFETFWKIFHYDYDLSI